MNASEQDRQPSPDTPASADAPAKPPRSRLMRLFGLRRRPGRRLRFVPTRWGWVLIIMIVMLGGMVGMAEYSMQPDFCRSCHIMEPYYQAWHQSTHKDVPCGDCHFEPGWQNTIKGKFEASSQAVKYITNTYGSKPHAEVHDVSCLRSDCHAKRKLEGKVEWTVKTQRGDEITIHFDHTPHLDTSHEDTNEPNRDMKLRCVSCHSQMVQGKHITVTLDTCFLCHFKGKKHGRDEQAVGGCGSCHGAPKKTIRLEMVGDFNHADYIDKGVECWNCHSDAISGDGEVPRQQCWNCHNKPQNLSRYGDKHFIHENHVTNHKVECNSCHVQIIHHLNAKLPRGIGKDMATSHELLDEGSCSQCHTDSHNAPQMLYSGRGGRGVKDMPSPMFRSQVDCIGCHQNRIQHDNVVGVGEMVYEAGQASCDHCHGNKYAGELEIWKQVMADLQATAKKGEEQATGMMKTFDMTPAKRLELQRKLDDARHNLKLVELGHGVHNVTYATALLNVAKENCREIVQAIEKMQTQGAGG